MANQINIGVGADISNLKKGMTEAASTMKSAGDQMAAVGANVESTTTTSFKNLQQAYRTTAKDAQVLAMTLGTESEAFQQAAQKAAMFKDQLDDVNDVINAYHPEKKWKVTSDAIGGAANVAQGFVGVMQLIGVESMNAEKAIATMLALNGIAQAVQSVEALKGAFIALSGTMQVALGAVALLGAAYLIYNSHAAEVEEANARIAESFKKIEEAEKGIIDIVKSTNDLRIKAMKEGVEKRKAIAENDYKNQLSLLIDANQKGEIADVTYQQRKKYLWQIYQNELTKIQKDAERERGKITPAPKPTQQNKLKENENLRFELPTTEIDSKNIGLQAISNVDLLKQKLLELKPIGTDAFISLGGEVNKLGVFFDELGDKIGGWANMAANALTGVGVALGQALMTGDFDEAAKSIVRQLGNIAVQIGAAMIAIGVPQAAVGLPSGFGYIAGGTALTIVGGAMMASGVAPNSKNSGGGGNDSIGSSSPAFTPDFAASSQYLMLDSRVRGTDIIISADNQRRQNRRIR